MWESYGKWGIYLLLSEFFGDAEHLTMENTAQFYSVIILPLQQFLCMLLCEYGTWN